MRVFLTGGTGAVGKHALRALVEAGHTVTALTRSKEKARWVEAEGAKPVHASLFDRDELCSVMHGHEAVVNLATAIPPNSDFMKASAWEVNDRIRIEGSANLVDAALGSRVRRFIQESVVMLYKDGGNAWLDETAETDEYPMAQGNHAAEANAMRFGATTSGDAVVLRFGWFYGPGATHSEDFFDLARKWGICVMFGAPSTWLSSINVIDAGRAVEAALQASDGVYNVTDDEPLTKKNYADAVASASGRKFYLRAPGRLARLLGNKTTSLTRSVRASNRAFKDETGWAPAYPSARQGWRALAVHKSGQVDEKH